MFIDKFRWLLYRFRRKKIVILLVILLLLINAMLYVSLELYNTLLRQRNNRLKYSGRSYNDKLRVIVGHYNLGEYSNKTLTSEVINSNNYAPVEGAGEGGRPVMLLQRELIPARELYKLHSYNILVSDKISVNRSLPDARSDSCKQLVYDLDSMPTCTVIIVFHNEAWSTLVRTVMSVILRSPEAKLKQIILVDDASERRYLGKELEDTIEKLSKVSLLRLKERTGLVGARLHGARAATGDVLVFLDAHCEVTTGWLEPLLDRAGSDDVFVCPHIDLINEDTFSYTKSIDAHWGAFSWHLQFRWLMPSPEVSQQRALYPAKPYPTPAMAGGLFAVTKSLFWRLGGYDEGMYIWGGENLELSWRAWQCGAKLEISPCSRVGHIFRRRSPYKYPGGVTKVLNSNLARAAAVWMDEWSDFFFKFHPAIAEIRDQQNVADRIALRKNLGCKNFEWYLRNIWPGHFFPMKERWFGRIKNEMGACLGVVGSSTPGLGGPASGILCGGDLDLDSMLVYTPEGQVMADEGLCLEQGHDRALWKHCSDSPKQIWEQKGTQLKLSVGLCLSILIKPNSTDGIGEPLGVTRCRRKKEQRWHFDRIPWS